jgi:hypothetical protein
MGKKINSRKVTLACFVLSYGSVLRKRELCLSLRLKDAPAFIIELLIAIIISVH